MYGEAYSHNRLFAYLGNQIDCTYRRLTRYHAHNMTSSFSTVYAVSTDARDAAWNMSFDTSLFKLFRTGKFQKQFGSGSMLWRFYSWSPPAVSLGYGQRSGEIDEESCRARNIEIVKRPTGGRAVFHIDEFTYSVLAETGQSNTVIYAMVHEVIREALLHMGIKADFCRTTPDMRKHYDSAESVSCFTASARNELHVDGRKIVGSAQRRSKNVILQHGSLLLSGRHKMISELLRCKDKRVLASIADDLDHKTVSVAELTGNIPDFSVLGKTMIAAISRKLETEVQLLEEQDIKNLF